MTRAGEMFELIIRDTPILTKYKPNINLGSSEDKQAASRAKYKAN